MIRTSYYQLFFILLYIVNHSVFGNDEEKEKHIPDFGNFGCLGLDNPCPSYSCSGRMIPVQKICSKYILSGCSAMSVNSMMMIQKRLQQGFQRMFERELWGGQGM